MKNELPSKEEMISFRQKHFLPTPTLYHKEPLHLVTAEGCYVTDDKGKRYLDGIGGIVCISAGHNHPRIKEALIKIISENEIQHTSVLYLNRHAMELAEKLLEEAPEGIDRYAFTNSGSEANELALMAARQTTGETMVINLRHSYHGGTSGTLAHCGHANWRFRSQPVAATSSAMEPYCYRCPFNKTPDSCELECAKNVETTIQTTTSGKIAAFIAEPVMGVGGFISPPNEYFQAVSKIVHNYGGKYISDEVQTGAGRCGKNFLLTKDLGIKADIVTMAKGLGNGAAIGAALMTSEIADSLKGKLYFNTFGADPYQTLQAKVNMEIIEDEGLIENAQTMGKLLSDGLKQMMKTHTLIGDVRGRGLLLGVELVKDRTTKTHAPEETARLMDLCKDKGLLLGKGGLFGNVLRIAPPISIKKDEVNFMLKAIDESLHELKRA
jgi:alanine-glyoxylate transaminase / (R)-3-amino-2-methylpropionate-pyruvate transaminase